MREFGLESLSRARSATRRQLLDQPELRCLAATGFSRWARRRAMRKSERVAWAFDADLFVLFGDRHRPRPAPPGANSALRGRSAGGAPSWRPWLPVACAVCLYRDDQGLGVAARKAVLGGASGSAVYHLAQNDPSRPQPRHPKGHRQGAAPGRAMGRRRQGRRGRAGPSGGGDSALVQARRLAGDGDPRDGLAVFALPERHQKAATLEPRTGPWSDAKSCRNQATSLASRFRVRRPRSNVW